MEDTADSAPIASTSALPPSPLEISPATLNRSRTHVQLGDSVLLQLPSKNIKVVKLTEGNNIVNLGKYGSFDARTQLFGRPYGLTLEIVAPPSAVSSPANLQHGDGTGNTTDSTTIAAKSEQDSEMPDSQPDTTETMNGKQKDNKKKTDKPAPATPQALCTLRPYEELMVDEIEVDEATNENILATGAKTLSHEDILELKRQGMDGREIIARQIAEHEAFELKNAYSKAKYQKRKESKYLKYFTLLPPTMYNICKYQYENESKRIRELRPDSLAQVITLANIRPGSRVIVVDDAGGLVVGSIAERMAGQGIIYQLHQNDSPPSNPLLPLFNLPTSYTSSEILKALHFGWTDETWESADSPAEDVADDSEKTDKQKYRAMKRKHAQEAQMKLVNEYRAGEFDALIVCSQYEPMSILKRLMPVLCGSAQIVIHSPVIQPLSDMLQALLPLETILNPTITEPFLRQYQVLPGRTHPEMNGTAHGGFILHATKVVLPEIDGEKKNFAIGKGQERRNNKRKKR